MKITEDFIDKTFETKEGRFIADNKMFYSIPKGNAQYIYEISEHTEEMSFMCIAANQRLYFSQDIIPYLSILSDERVRLLSVEKHNVEKALTRRFIEEHQNDSPLSKNDLILAERLAKEQKYLGLSPNCSSHFTITNEDFHKILQETYSMDYLYYKTVDNSFLAEKNQIIHGEKIKQQTQLLLSSGKELIPNDRVQLIKNIQNLGVKSLWVYTSNRQIPYRVPCVNLCKSLISNSSNPIINLGMSSFGFDEIESIVNRNETLYENRQLQHKTM